MNNVTSACCTFLVLCFVAVTGYTDEPPVSGQTAQQSWVAFECALLAKYSKKEEEYGRLFTYAYEQGKAFIVAIKDKKITEEEIKKAPMYMLMMLSGPSPDFMLGHIYGFIDNSSYKEVTNRMKKEGVGEIGMLSDELRESWASNMFQEQNCDLIGQ